MTTASETLHEPASDLEPATIECHRALSSLKEELEAVDWYAQRVEATQDGELRAILAHNRDEEKEHAAMILEWLRRQDHQWDEQLRAYLFTEMPLSALEAHEEEAEPRASRRMGSLGIGSLRGRVNHD
jgi:ferritin-like protein